MIKAKVILDSVSPKGKRLTTMEVTFHRFILSEVNTHRVLSKNSASSRAIPVAKKIKQIIENPAIPLEFGLNQPGMQADERLEGDELLDARETWLEAAQDAVRAAQTLSEQGIHKQVVNRLLEPFMWHTAILTSTEWTNFFKQRLNSDAQPEIHALARFMQNALTASVPYMIGQGEWHTPYLKEADKLLTRSQQIQVSVARCARVSYLTHDGKRSIEKDLDLYQKLVTANPPHWSPLEHVATPADPDDYLNTTAGNFLGWAQLRHQKDLP